MGKKAHIKTAYDPIAWQMLVGDVLLLLASIWRFFEYNSSKPIFLISTFILLDGACILLFGRAILHPLFRASTPAYKGAKSLPFADMHFLNVGYLIGGLCLTIASIFFCLNNFLTGQIVFLVGTLFLADTSLYGFNRKSFLSSVIGQIQQLLSTRFIQKPPFLSLILFFIGSLLLFIANLLRISDYTPHLMPYIFLVGSYALFEGSNVSLFGRTTFGYQA